MWAALTLIGLGAGGFWWKRKKDKDDDKLRGGTGRERNIVKQEAVNAYNEIPKDKYPRVKPFDKKRLKLIPHKNRGIARAGGQPQGIWKRRKDGSTVYGDATGHKMNYARPLSRALAKHEMKHVIMVRAGYVKESSAHVRDVWRDGGRVR